MTRNPAHWRAISKRLRYVADVLSPGAGNSAHAREEILTELGFPTAKTRKDENKARQEAMLKARFAESTRIWDAEIELEPEPEAEEEGEYITIGGPMTDEDYDRLHPKVRFKGELFRIHKELGDGSKVRLVTMDGESVVDVLKSETTPAEEGALE
jgi:hypothetical protein